MIDIELRKALKNINLKDITEILIHHDKVKDRFIFCEDKGCFILKKNGVLNKHTYSRTRMLGLLNIAWNAGFDIFIELINGEAINLKLFSDIINHTSAVTIFDNKTGDSFILSESDDYFEKERTGQTYSFFDIHKLIELALDADFKVYLI